MNHRLPTLVLAVIAALVLSACAGTGSTPAPSPSPSGEPLTQAELKLALLDRFGNLWYCDPDEYPIPRGEPLQIAQERFPEVEADREAYDAITARLGVAAEEELEPDQKLAVYQLWKVLNAIELTDIGNGLHRFDILTVPPAGQQQGTRTMGTIDLRGQIEVQGQAQEGEPACPICLARGTLIDTPAGRVKVEDLRVGASIWTTNAAGRRVDGVVVSAGNTPVPASHRVVHLVLDDGREVVVSPGHPLGDGRLVGDLEVGDVVDGAFVVSAQLVSYGGGATYDILASGPSGAYWAGGILLGSTLDR
jgi:hypothetical protein